MGEAEDRHVAKIADDIKAVLGSGAPTPTCGLASSWIGSASVSRCSSTPETRLRPRAVIQRQPNRSDRDLAPPRRSSAVLRAT